MDTCSPASPGLPKGVQVAHAAWPGGRASDLTTKQHVMGANVHYRFAVNYPSMSDLITFPSENMNSALKGRIHVAEAELPKPIDGPWKTRKTVRYMASVYYSHRTTDLKWRVREKPRSPGYASTQATLVIHPQVSDGALASRRQPKRHSADLGRQSAG